MFIVTEVDPRVRLDKDGSPPVSICVTKFDEEAVAEFRRSMCSAVETGQPIVPVVIDSWGGDVYAALAMADIIRAQKAIVATVVNARAGSCGALLLAYGTEGYRFVGPRATVMVHDVWQEVPERKKTGEAIADAEELKRVSAVFFQSLDSCCGKPSGFFEKLVASRDRADCYLDAREAVKHNLANHIGLPTLTLSVRAEYTISLDTPAPSPGLVCELPKRRKGK